MTDQDQSRLAQVREFLPFVLLVSLPLVFLSAAILMFADSFLRNPTGTIVTWVVYGVGAYVLLRLSERLPPIPLLTRLHTAYRRFAESLTRRFIPDSVYKLWYEVGMLDADTFREYQDRGWIDTDLDPEYIQRID